MQRVERGEVALAGDAEDHLDAVEHELVDEDPSAGSGRHCGCVGRHPAPRYFAA
jgi:hypothetical protein